MGGGTHAGTAGDGSTPPCPARAWAGITHPARAAPPATPPATWPRKVLRGTDRVEEGESRCCVPDHVGCGLCGAMKRAFVLKGDDGGQCARKMAKK